MCSIFGALVWHVTTEKKLHEVNYILGHIYRHAHIRGRDGRGYTIQTGGDRIVYKDIKNIDRAVLGEPILDLSPRSFATVIGNTRAEPTTEYIKEKSREDQQPYGKGTWQIVHNGTIANDRAIRELTQDVLESRHWVPTKIDSAAIAEALECESIAGNDHFEQFKTVIKRLKGSFAILATTMSEKDMFVAANYRPIWYIHTECGVFFASTRDSFPSNHTPRMIQPYTIMHFGLGTYNELEIKTYPLTPPGLKNKALVICSGGLDSVVSATYAQRVHGFDVELIHFVYGSRAGGPESDAVQAVAQFLEVPLHIKMLPMWDQEDSPLLQSDSKIAGGEEGAEFAHEWVPARNLVMLAVATAYAEAKGFTYIILGNNLEEAGAYPDNEPEFINKFNDLLPFAVGDGKKVSVIMPVGNMMKHEIVKLGAEIEAPMHLTWSCYRAGKLHCGKCGPCFMRRTAFQINNLPEVIDYEV